MNWCACWNGESESDSIVIQWYAISNYTLFLKSKQLTQRRKPLVRQCHCHRDESARAHTSPSYICSFILLVSPSHIIWFNNLDTGGVINEFYMSPCSNFPMIPLPRGDFGFNHNSITCVVYTKETIFIYLLSSAGDSFRNIMRNKQPLNEERVCMCVLTFDRLKKNNLHFVFIAISSLNWSLLQI